MSNGSSIVKVPQITITQAIDIVERTPREVPIMIWGDTGIGKSQIVNQIGARHGMPVMVEIAQVRSQVDFMGLPIIERKNDKAYTTFTAPLCLPHVEEHGSSGIWFLDEFPNAQRSVQAAVQSIILHGQYNGYTLPDEWSVIIAGNRITDKANTYEMPRPVRARLMHLYVKPDLDAFLDWGIGKEPPTSDVTIPFPSIHSIANRERLHPLVRAFLKRRPEFLHHEMDGVEPIACPRTWECVSWVMYTKPGERYQQVMFNGLVGPSAATEFAVFLQDASILPDPIDLLTGKVEIKTVRTDGVSETRIGSNGSEQKLSASQLWALSTSLASAVNDKKYFDGFFDVISAIHAREYQLLAVKDLFMRNKDVWLHPKCKKWGDEIRPLIAAIN